MTRTRVLMLVVAVVVLFLVISLGVLRFVRQRYDEREVDEPPPRVTGLTTFQLLNAETAQPIVNENIRVTSRSQILCLKCNVVEREWFGQSDATGVVRIPPENIHYMMRFGASGDVVGMYNWNDADGPVRVVELISNARAVDLRPMMKFVDQETGKVLAGVPIRMTRRCDDRRILYCTRVVSGMTNALGNHFFALRSEPRTRGDATIEITGYQPIDYQDAILRLRRVPMVRAASD